MSSFLLLFAAALILTAEGSLLARAVSRKPIDFLFFALGYPLGVFVNVALFLVLHLIGIPFGANSVFLGHLLVIVSLLICGRTVPLFAECASLMHFRCRGIRPVVLLCSVLVLVVFLISAVWVATLPMLYWDSFAHWALRSKQMLHAGFITSRDVIQPQYPMLMHALQMFHAILPGWSDQIVNGGTFLLSLTLLAGIFFLSQRRTDVFGALITVTLLTGVPIVIIHLRQGMADIHVSLYVLLSALLLDCAFEKRDWHALCLSALFVAAAAWTKFEGLYFGVLPWVGIVLLYWLNEWKRGRLTEKAGKKGYEDKKVVPLCLFYPSPPSCLFLCLLAAAPWPAFVFSQGMKLSPHGRSFAVHLDALPHVLMQLFSYGTFGLHVWAVAIVLLLVLFEERRRLIGFLRSRPSLLWAIISFVLLLYVFLFTNEVRGLVERDNFSRVAMLPVLLFTAALSVEGWRRWHFIPPIPTLFSKSRRTHPSSP